MVSSQCFKVSLVTASRWVGFNGVITANAWFTGVITSNASRWVGCINVSRWAGLSSVITLNAHGCFKVVKWCDQGVGV